MSSVPEPLSPLQAIAAHDQFAEPDLPAIVRAWLERTMVESRYARLGQAGHSSTRLTLAQVFIDIATSASSRESDESAELPPGIVAEMLQKEPAPIAMDSRFDEPCDNQIVLIGGPGQGKSTTGQYLAQIHRAALLAPFRSELDDEHGEIRDQIARQVDAEMPGGPVQPCIPARIVLSELAAWMVRTSIEPARGVGGFLCEQIGKPGDAIFDSDLHTLFDIAPWLFLFDGLDEVPLSGGRDLVVTAIQAFRGQLKEYGARALVVATTRPQGYAGEFGPRFVTAHLQPLSPKRAMAYARKLIEDRYPTDRHDTLLQRMEQACTEPATARLMGSPLQVTIMAALVDRVGRPPHQRWLLFRDYYRVIYEREIERPHSQAAALLRDQRAHINKVHQQVGLLLQVESERSGGTETLLTREQLMMVVDRHLLDEGFARHERTRLVEDMVRVATDRLVFLVSPQRDHYGFEIRSLQEFMAAEALMDGSDEHVKERLRRIAPLSLWRNVLLFATGKCTVDRPHLRDFVVDDLLDGLEQTGHAALDSTHMASAHLALDLIEDGSFDSASGHLARLARRAVEILALPPSPNVVRLVRLGQDKVRAEVRRFYNTRWQGRADERSGWLGLVTLAEAGEEWACALAEKHWPAGDGDALQLIRDTERRSGEPMGEWFAAQVLHSLGDIRIPWDFGFFFGWLAGAPPHSARAYLTEIATLSDFDERSLTPITIQSAENIGFTLGVHKCGDTKFIHFDLQALSSAMENPGVWQVYISAVRLAQQPTHEQLAAELDMLARVAESVKFTRVAENVYLRRHARNVPWPLGACLAQATSADEFRQLAERARAGELGSVDDWHMAEERWSEHGIDPVALVSPQRQWPLSGATADFVPPLPTIFQTFSYPSPRREPSHQDHVVRALLDGYQHQTSTAERQYIARFLWNIIDNAPDIIPRILKSAANPVQIAQSLEPVRFISHDHVVSTLLEQTQTDPAWIEVFDELGRKKASGMRHTYPAGQRSHVIRALTDLCRNHPARHGLWRLLARMLSPFESDVEMSEMLPLDNIDDEEARYYLGLTYLSQGSLEGDAAREWFRTVARQAAGDFWPLLKVLRGNRFLRIPPGRTGHSVDAAEVSSLEEREERRVLAIDLLTIAHEQAPADNVEAREDLLDAIHAHWSRRASQLAEPEVWNQLALPAPSPHALMSKPAGEALDTSGMLALTRIDRVDIRDIRCLADITMELPGDHARAAESGRWIVLVGENGTGKSTILRALVLALAAPDVAAGLVSSSVSSLVRHSHDAGSASVRIQGATFQAALRVEDGREELVRRNGAPPADRPWLFAYGCGRGSALGGPDREVAYTESASVITLFDDSAGLLSAETWLKLLQLDALKYKGTHQDRLDMVLGTIKTILPGVQSIDIDSQGVWLSGDSVGEHTPLSGLSDGYLTTIGWITDLMARWLHRADQRRLLVQPDFPARMEGLVLVDEIDLHLHPRWQGRIIDDLRKTFPRMSFVVTTHNPLTLLGARPGEIFVVRRARDPRDHNTHSDHQSMQSAERIEVVPCDPPRGLRADQVLTGQWFGLASTLDPESLELLEKHRRMLRERVAATDPARLALEQTLRERLGHFSETPLEQLAQEVAAEVVDESYATRSPAEKLALRRRFKDMLAQRRRERGDQD